MATLPTSASPPYSAITARDLEDLPQLAALGPEARLAMRAVAAVLPFRTNPYVVNELIDWDRAPDDPIYQLTFPQPGMLPPSELSAIMDLLRAGAPPGEVRAAARRIQMQLNPHPAGQVSLNVPTWRGQPLRGVQHKYRETVLFFPSAGQTCHAYCTYCFRWPQFVGLEDLRFASADVDGLVDYLRANPDVTSVLITGGDPLVMKTSMLRRIVEPLLAADLPHLATIRLGTKALAYWPQRFVTDADADDLMRLIEQVELSGRSLALMAHYSHPRELETPMAQRALRRVRSAGAVVRCQAPLVRHVNDNGRTWAQMWRLQVQLGAVPYYMFVERDTGPRGWFEVPLARAAAIYAEAIARVSGLCRTARGPSMSATPGKVVIDGVADIAGERVFALRFLQARDPTWLGRPFFARYDAAAVWFDQLRPAFGEPRFFFEDAMDANEHRTGRWAPPLDRRRLAVFPGSVEVDE